MKTNRPNLNLMSSAIRTTCRAMLRDFSEIEHLQRSPRGTGPFVRRSYNRARANLVRQLQDARPDYGWMGDGEGEPGKDPTRKWILCPLHGRTNFARAIGHWAVAAALEHKGRVTCSVIYDAVRNEVYSADRGAGSLLNQSRLRCSGRKSIPNMLFATSSSAVTDSPKPRFFGGFAEVAAAVSGMRITGSNALDLLHLAAGRIDCIWAEVADPSSLRPALLIAREAGAICELTVTESDEKKSIWLTAASGDAFDAFITELTGKSTTNRRMFRKAVKNYSLNPTSI